jgi:hypothetical protein
MVIFHSYVSLLEAISSISCVFHAAFHCFQEERLAEAKAHLTLARDALRASDAYPFWDSHGQFWDGE